MNETHIKLQFTFYVNKYTYLPVSYNSSRIPPL